jgi:hypothetical protein
MILEACILYRDWTHSGMMNTGVWKVYHLRQRSRLLANVEVDSLADNESSQWFEYLSESERAACAAELTDLYFAALTSGEWQDLHAAVQRWMKHAADAALIPA